MEDIADLKTLSSVIRSSLGGPYHDATLLVEGEKIPVHRIILASWSNYFKELFQVEAGQSSGNSVTLEGAACNSQDIVEIKDVKVRNNNVYELSNVKAEVFKSVLHYIYSGTYKFTGEIENKWHALELAHMYNLESLETKLAKYLVESIDADNFVDFYNLNTQIQNDDLEISCLDFMEKNAEEIAKSDNFSRLTLDSLLSLLDDDNFATTELDIFRAAEKWANVNKPNKETINAIVKKIRLATLSQEDLFVVVAASKDLPSIDILEPVRSIALKYEASTNFREQPTEETFAADENVALSSLGAKLLTGNVHEADLISGSDGWTTHRVGGKPDCITVQLDKPYKINHLKFTLKADGERTYKYHIEVSIKGVEWSKVVDRSNKLCSSYQSLRFDPTEVKFIKLTGVNCKDLTVSSLEAMYSTNQCIEIDGISVATTNVTSSSKGGKATGTQTVHYSGSSQVARCSEYCIDGKENTYARININETLLITLPQPHWISSLRMLIEAHGHNYTIESSPDGESWQPVCDEVLGDELKVWCAFEFSRRIVAQFRIKMKKINPNYNYIDLYSFESPASTIPVTSEHLPQTS